MVTFVIVLAFPAITFAAFGVASSLLRHRPRALDGPLGWFLYCGLLLIPLAAILLARPDFLAARFAWRAWTPLWVAAGVAVALGLYGGELWRVGWQEPDEPTIWVGPPGRRGYALMMLLVGYGVVAEEIVWRGYLTEFGLAFASAAFALIHWHFGAWHLIFTFAAGLLWGSLMLFEEGLYGCVASHLTYNALVLARMRRRDSHPAP
jgi:membrane protease YdiL (CAAX protease family)